MKMVKSLLLGSAAGLVALSGAQAADLPVKAKPVQYVKICSLYGAGFYYMPGTDTCIKIGGAVRSETNFNQGGSGTPLGGAGVIHLNDRNNNFEDWRTRSYLTADARSQTEYGTLRSYLAIAATSDMSGTSGSALPAPNNGGGSSAYVRLYAYAAYVQFAGFTFGKTDTFFDFDTMGYMNGTMIWGTNEGGNGIEVWAYTAQFGNGLSATLSAENSSGERNGVAFFGVDGYYGRETWPDIVANLRVDQAWGSAQIMGAIHDVTAKDASAVLPAPSDAIGWAIGGGAKFNLPMIGKGDYFQTQVTYTEGALRYITGNYGTQSGPAAITVTSGDTVTGIPTTSYGALEDAVVTGTVASYSLDLTKAWAITGGFEHHWNLNWRSSLWGDYGHVGYSTGLNSASAYLGYTVNGDASFSLWQIGSRTVWTPVENLDLSLEIVYNNINGGNTTNPLTTNNQDWLSGMVRVQRNFMP